MSVRSVHGRALDVNMHATAAQRFHVPGPGRVRFRYVDCYPAERLRGATVAHLFISYKRNVEPDDPLAAELFKSLVKNHQVFIDRTMTVGQDWVARIQSELEAADFLILLLSEHSIQSQMVIEEVRMASASFRRVGKPQILPLRISFAGALPYDLGAILNRVNYAMWKSSADTPSILAQLEAATGGQQLPEFASPQGKGLPAEIPLPTANPKMCLEATGGTMAAASPFYIERTADKIALDEQSHSSFTLTIKGQRQMGKSSLLGRVMAKTDKRVAFLDFQEFEPEILKDPVLLFQQFCFMIGDALDLPAKVEDSWRSLLGPAQNCKLFMERYILPECGDKGLLLAIDQADSLLDSPLCISFFGMLRVWQSRSVLRDPWKKLSLVMAISSEPSLLIADTKQSPFNVGATVVVEDFSLDETRHADEAHGSPLDESGLRQLYALLAGHPYLTRRALYLICKQRYAFSSLLAEADFETGPFGDHLRALLARLACRPGLEQALKVALVSGRCEDAMRHWLIAGGLIREEGGGRLGARNQLYGRYFTRVLNA